MCPFLGLNSKNVSSRCPVKSSSGLLCNIESISVTFPNLVCWYFSFYQQIPSKKDSNQQLIDSTNKHCVCVKSRIYFPVCHRAPLLYMTVSLTVPWHVPSSPWTHTLWFILSQSHTHHPAAPNIHQSTKCGLICSQQMHYFVLFQ